MVCGQKIVTVQENTLKSVKIVVRLFFHGAAAEAILPRFCFFVSKKKDYFCTTIQPLKKDKVKGGGEL